MSKGPRQIVVSGGFDDLRSRQIRFLQEAARLGDLTVLLWPDEAIREFTGANPKFPLAERHYFLSAIRYVSRVIAVPAPLNPEALPAVPGFEPQIWVDEEGPANPARGAFCRRQGLEYRVRSDREIQGFPEPTSLHEPEALGPLSPPRGEGSPKRGAQRFQGGKALSSGNSLPTAPGRKKVIVTGCYDWLHSGHVRFFEEVSTYGDLYVVVGHDANIHALKGAGHPLLSDLERRYLVGSIKYVKQALISSGQGWLDADPEIRRLKPDIYAVNEDGDKGGKREYCAEMGIEYLVLRRTPAPGLRARSSTDLRGF